ncbi:MAG: hypothetical protein MZV63_47740 [Marinilabiliales bacterium]|nr:hypothetical protein [Marinilabiliales bacterium]
MISPMQLLMWLQQKTLRKQERGRQKAYDVKTRADEIFNYIQDLKVEIITKAEGQESEALLPDNQIDIIEG